ncbi:hypothetical protein CC86DRAFT_94485 [Ophiobolus disseminans]|uniref:Uncharacterized protein n=1 Tax=Ophiobolus disseminans TaxID=1469910 RepID=A0A6A6ZMA0_9PLEO|nr:hypothetical protein CC86DRAFT_94485 [Ophiobolus disseminans]
MRPSVVRRPALALEDATAKRSADLELANHRPQPSLRVVQDSGAWHFTFLVMHWLSAWEAFTLGCALRTAREKYVRGLWMVLSAFTTVFVHCSSLCDRPTLRDIKLLFGRCLMFDLPFEVGIWCQPIPPRSQRSLFH